MKQKHKIVVVVVEIGDFIKDGDLQNFFLEILENHNEQIKRGRETQNKNKQKSTEFWEH